MAITAYPPSTLSTPDLTLLNVSRLITRLEHNLLSPGTEVSSLRRSAFQRMRVTKNVEYARSLLTNLERSLPHLRSLDKKYEAQTEISRDKELLKLMQGVLDEVEQYYGNDEDEDDEELDVEGGQEWEDVFSKPVAVEKVVSAFPAATSGLGERVHISAQNEWDSRGTDSTALSPSPAPAPATTTATATATATTSPSPPAPTTTTTSTLRNRHQSIHPSSSTTTSASTSQQPSKLATTEQTLRTHRLEQEDLKDSLLSNATQLKTLQLSFHEKLEREKTVLDRAVHGIDRTAATMEAAGRRMGMLRRMTEGQGWWGRLMLYIWIFGLWLLALLIVFVGPKLRF